MKKKKRVLIRILALMLMICSISLTSWAQQSIKGKVVDADGLPLPGAAAVVQGTTDGTVTNNDGEYTISAPSDGTLEFSFVGMITVVEKINGRTTIDVTMQTDAIGIEEIVAVGYGTMKKADITGAVASVKGGQLAAVGSFSAAQAMQGKMAGVIVTNNGDAGGDSKIRIRGVNTIGNNDPLIVVDGSVTGGSLEDINPNDIESIDVLKDASALAIYGSRASSGVIQVTTKKGKYGDQKLTVTVDASYGIATVPQRLDLTNAAQTVAIIDEARMTENAMRGNTAQKLYSEIFSDATKYPDPDWGKKDITNWQDEIFNTGVVQDYALSAVGGAKNATYAFGVSYRDQEGTMPGNFASRMVTRGNFEFKVLNDKLKIGSTFNYSIREGRSSTQGYIWSADIVRSAQTPGNIPAYFPNSTKGYQETDPVKIGYFTPGDLYQNAAVIFDDYSNPIHNVTTTLYADLEIIKGLNFKTLYGQNYSQNFRRNYTEQSMNPQGDPAKLDVSSNRNAATSWDNTLTYDKKWDAFSINAMAGTNIYNSLNNRVQADRTGFPEGDPDALRYLGFGAPTSALNSETSSNVRLASYFGRLNLNYADKYLLTASVRRDGSSRFAEEVRWGVFPSFSLGWRLSEEAFMSGASSWLNNLKIRGSWGQVGNQNVGSDYAYVSTVQSGTVSSNNLATDQTMGLPLARNTGKVIWQIGNEAVTWETTTMANIGVDFGINKLNGTLEVFQNNTDDILLAAQYPDIAGYFIGATQKINSGKIQTSGLEFSLNYGDKKGDFGYNVGVNFTYSENEIMSLSTNQFILGGNTNFKQIAQSMSRAYVGDPVGSFYGWQTDGIFNTQEEVDAANANARKLAQERATAAGKPLTEAQLAGIYMVNSFTSPGDYKFKDNDGDGLIGDNDKAYLGSGTPKVQYGINFSCDYKSFDLAVNMLGVAGVQIYSMFEPGLSDPYRWTKLTSIMDHWTPENKTTNYPRYTASDPNKNIRSSDKWIHDGGYFRFQNIILGYTLPSNWAGKIGLGKVRAFVNMQNVLTITNYPFLDPEVIGSNSDGATVDTASGVDVGSAPTPRTTMFGININF